MRTSTRALLALTAATAVLGVTASQASAHECVNASKKNQAAGVQLVINDADELVWISRGLQTRIDRGLVDPETGEGFSGLIGFDVDGDGAADFSTWIVGPDGELPTQAQYNGATCQGVMNIGEYFEQCFGGADPV